MKNYTSNNYTVLAPEAGDMDSVEHVEDMLDSLTAAMLPKDKRDAFVNGSTIVDGELVVSHAAHADEADHATSADAATAATTASKALSLENSITIAGQTFDGSQSLTVALDVENIANASRIYYGTEVPTFTANNGDLYVRLY